MITQGIILIIPIFFWAEHINQLNVAGNLNSSDAQTCNSLLIYSSSVSILYGLGSGFFYCGVISYCAIVS